MYEMKIGNEMCRRYKFLTLMSTIYVTLLILTMIVENHVVILVSFKVLSGTLVLPLAYAVSDVFTYSIAAFVSILLIHIF